jgi:hypothetical protein
VAHVQDNNRASQRWEWLGWPVRLGSTARREIRARVPLDPLHRPASVATRAIPPILVVVGLTMSILSAIVLEDVVSEGVATLGVEVGAALWFGGVIAWSVRRTTVGRVLLLMTAAVAGLMLIAVALALGWTGAALALSMEFGVGALAIVVIDLIVVGTLHPGLDTLARRAPGTIVDIELGWRWPPLTIRIEGHPPAG